LGHTKKLLRERTEKEVYMKRFESGKLGVAVVLIGVAITLGCLVLHAEAAETTAVFNATGELMLPKDYRQWVFLGAPVTPNELNNGKAAFPEFHHVYIHPANFAAYKKTGSFPNGTILVKELISVGAKSASSGNGYFPGDYIGVAAAVKDSKRFPKEPGNWAYFSLIGEGGKPLASAKAQATAACNTCHQDGAAQDWVFTQFYPVLKAARPK
jgi:hypothetical protein